MQSVLDSVKGEMKIFAANASKDLATKIAKHLGVELGKATVSYFHDGEINMRILETVRGADVFIIQSTSHPVNDHLMELLIMIDAMRRSSAGRITCVMPYFGYARQDRRAKSHDPISAKLVADLITTAGANRILTMDLHSPQIQGFFNIPVDHLRGIPLFAYYWENKGVNKGDYVVVSPDLGSVSRCSTFADRLGLDLAIVNKRRPDDDVSEAKHFIGSVRGKYAILVDDQLATGGSITNAANLAIENGATGVCACVTHPVLCSDAVEKINSSRLDKVLVLDTIVVPEEKLADCSKLEVLSVAKFVSEAICCIHDNKSIGKLFKSYDSLPDER